jgi:hypothetical protein
MVYLFVKLQGVLWQQVLVSDVHLSLSEHWFHDDPSLAGQTAPGGISPNTPANSSLDQLTC